MCLACQFGLFLYTENSNEASHLLHLPGGILRTNEIIAIKSQKLFRRKELKSFIVEWAVLPVVLHVSALLHVGWKDLSLLAPQKI